MLRRLSRKTGRSHLPLVASAILGMLIAVFPNPAFPADCCRESSGECDSPWTPDGTQECDSLDEVYGLASTWPISRVRPARTRVFPPPPRATEGSRPRFRTVQSGTPPHLPILLCRLTC